LLGLRPRNPTIVVVRHGRHDAVGRRTEHPARVTIRARESHDSTAGDSGPASSRLDGRPSTG
jgi:hypothetical protein